MRRKREKKTTLVAELYAGIVALERSIIGTLPDKEMDNRVMELFAATTSMTHAPAANVADIDLKFRILCRRLGEFLDPDDRGGVLTYLLAESLWRDLRLISEPTNVSV